MTLALQTYTSVASLQADTVLTPGQIVQTLGYSQPGIGGNTYEIIAAAGTADHGSLLALANSAIMARGLFPSGQVNVSQFGALAGTDSSDAFADALAFAPEVQVTAAELPYQISRELTASTCRRLFSEGAALHFTSVQDQRGLVFPDSNGLQLRGFTFTSQGTVDQFISAGPGDDLEIRNNTFDHAGASAALNGYQGGVFLNGVRRALIERNRFKNGHREVAPGSNNLDRALLIIGAANAAIQLRDNAFSNLIDAVYMDDCAGLCIDENTVTDTRGSAFIEQTPSGTNRQTQYLYNEFSNLGASAISRVLTEAEPVVGAELALFDDLLINGNIVEGWGKVTATQCLHIEKVAAAGGTTTQSQLKLVNNSLLQPAVAETDPQGNPVALTNNALKVIALDSVSVLNNVIRPWRADPGAVNAAESYTLTQGCNNVQIHNNEFSCKGTLTLAENHLGEYSFSNNQLSLNQPLRFANTDATRTPRLTVTDNQIDNTGAVAGPVYGLDATTTQADFTLIFTGNAVKTTLAKQDTDDDLSGKFMLGLAPSAALAQVVDNNMVEFSDALCSQKMIAGDLLHPIYYRELRGAGRISGNNIQYKTAINRTNQTFTVQAV